MATHAESVRCAGSQRFEFGDPTPNAVGRNALVSHDGCVVHLDGNSAPRLMWYGEDLLSVKMPAGTRGMYPNPPLPRRRGPHAPPRHPLDHPQAAEPPAPPLRPGVEGTTPT